MVVVRPPPPVSRLPPAQGSARMIRTTLAETQTDTIQTPSTSVTDSSTMVRAFPSVRRQGYRGTNMLISRNGCVPGSPNAQRRPAPTGPRTLSRTLDQRSDPALLLTPESPRGTTPVSGSRALNSASLGLGARAGAPNAALPSPTRRGAPRSWRRNVVWFSEGVAPPSRPGRAVAVGLKWVSGAGTLTP